MLAPMTDQASRICPDCGAQNAVDLEHCTECNHPMRPMAKRSAAPTPPMRPQRRPFGGPPRGPGGMVTEEPGKVIPRRKHERIGFFGVGSRAEQSGGAPGWIWFAVGTLALAIALFAAIGITTREPPFGVPGASPIQANVADSLYQALKRDSTNVADNIRLANLLYDTANFEKAVPFYRRAVTLDPLQIDARVDLAVSLHQSGRTGEALAELTQVLDVQPDHAVALFDLGVIYESLERYEEAAEAYAGVAELDIEPEMAHALEQRVRAVEQKMAHAGQ